MWRHREFLLLWGAQSVSAVGSRITRTALPIAAILVAGAGAIDLGLLTVALTLPGAIFSRGLEADGSIGTPVARC